MLATYAIGARYFTGAPVNDYFNAYCDHYNQPRPNGAEAAYVRHFRHAIRRMNGYEIIRCLHCTSQV
jgi:hypothetical protein